MQVLIKKFSDLDILELYQILQLRSEIFVVEQNCVYQDIDGKDEDALHVLGIKNDELVAYTRCFAKGIYFNEAAIGRVAVKQTERSHGFGHMIMEKSIEAIQEEYNTSTIKISAQRYLVSFYNSHGFKEYGEPYLEDGIPHVAMIKN